jgi:hypothetical protein
LSSIEPILIWICNVAEIHYSSVIVILARKNGHIEIAWVDVSDGMLVSVPSSEAQIESTHKGDIAVDETELFVMRPVQDHII